MDNHPHNLGFGAVCEIAAFEGRSKRNQSFGVAVAVEHISGSCSSTAEHVAAPRMGGSSLVVLGFQIRCGASFCKGGLHCCRTGIAGIFPLRFWPS